MIPSFTSGGDSDERAAAGCARHESLSLAESVRAGHCAERNLKMFGEFAVRWQLFTGRQTAGFDVRLQRA